MGGGLIRWEVDFGFVSPLFSCEGITKVFFFTTCNPDPKVSHSLSLSISFFKRWMSICESGVRKELGGSRLRFGGGGGGSGEWEQNCFPLLWKGDDDSSALSRFFFSDLRKKKEGKKNGASLYPFLLFFPSLSLWG
jgi:hypothetical protein